MDVTQLRARALWSAGRLAYFQSDFPGAQKLLEDALTLFRQTDDEVGTMSALSTLMVILTWQGRAEEVMALLREGLALLPSVQAHVDNLSVLSEFAWAASHASDARALEDAQILNEDVIAGARAAGDKQILGLALACLAQCYYWKGEWEQARPLFEESVALLRDYGALWMLEYAAWALGQTALQQGDFEEARVVSSEAMRRDRNGEGWVGAPYYLETFAFLAATEKQPRRAVRLMAAADAVRARHNGGAQPLVVAQNERWLDQLRTQLTSDEFECAWKAGRALTTEQAIILATKPLEAEDATR